MFPFRWRWPIFACLLTSVAYLSKNYTIDGLEHLHLEPRTQFSEATDALAQTSARDPFHVESNPFAITKEASTAWAEASHDGSWQEQPSSVVPTRGDWQDNTNRSSALGIETDSFNTERQPPFVTPIPIPPDFAEASLSPTSELQSGLFRTDPQLAVSPKVRPSAEPVPLETAIESSSPGRLSKTVLSPKPAKYIGQDSSQRSDLQTIRVASFNTDGLDQEKLSKPEVMGTFVRILAQYDVTALQQLQGPPFEILPAIIEQLNRSGRKFDFLVGPALGRLAPQVQYAFVFDSERVETDGYRLYTVEDPQDLLSYEPLVAWFRCKQVPRESAFTFSLVNLLIDRNLAAKEISLVPGLIQAIQNDGRREDDWIIVGDLAGKVQQLVESDPAIRSALPLRPTDVAGTQVCNAILFGPHATVEFVGRSGTFDFLRKYNLSIEQALEVSDYLPVWAEFSAIEDARSLPPVARMQ